MNVVDHPAHYNRGKIEVADFVSDQDLNFDLGSAVKYICRAGYKDRTKYVEDLQKAIWFISHEIKVHGENKEEKSSPGCSCYTTEDGWRTCLSCKNCYDDDGAIYCSVQGKGKYEKREGGCV